MSNSDELDVEEKKEIKCEICGDFSDGNHYDIQACRSCTAFFRRTVSFKKVSLTLLCKIVDFRNIVVMEEIIV